MLAGTYRITCDQGSVYERLFTILDGNGDPVNLTGFSARMQIRPELESNEIMLNLTSSNGGLILNAVNGEITVHMTPTQTAALETDGVYDIEIESSSGNVYRILKGRFLLNPEVTR